MAVVIILAACDSKDPDDGMTPTLEAATVQLTPPTITVQVPNSQQFTAVARDRAGNAVNTTFTWSSSNTVASTVTNAGVVSARAPGNTQIRATAANGVWGEAAVTVAAVNLPVPVVSSVVVTPSFAALTPTTTQQFTAVSRDAAGNIVNTTLTWASSASFIATVNSAGLASGVSAGSATIRATAASGAFGETTVAVTAPPPPEFRVASSQNLSASGRSPTVSVQVPTGQKVIGCGARVRFDPSLPGLMLTAVYPSDARTCTASARDHLALSEGTVEVWAIAVIDPQNEWDVNITSQSQAGTTATATLPPGFALTGGGGRITSTGAGVFMTSTRPSGSTWIVAGKEHIQTDGTGNTTSYAIGIRPRNGAAAPTSTVSFLTLTGLETRISAPSGSTLVSGGATVAWNGPGRLLVGSYPDITSWVAVGKEHLQPDTGTITSYAISIRVPW